MNFVDKWPKWLPYPLCWIKAFGVLYLYTSLFISVATEIMVDYLDGNISQNALGVELITSVIFCWLLLLPIIAFFHNWLCLALDQVILRLPNGIPGKDVILPRWLRYWPQKPRGWWPGWRSWGEGGTAMMALLLGLGIYFLLVGLFTGMPSSRMMGRLYGRMVANQGLDVWVFVVAIMAYLYFYDARIREWYQRRAAKAFGRQTLPTPVTPAVSVSVQNQVPRWYVMRNGDATGPFTLLQLSNEETISARTNVRREGETEWVRAGTVDELKSVIE